MKLISFKWHEIILISPGFCRLKQRLARSSRTPRACAGWPFLIVRDETQLVPWLLNHERIHLAQYGYLLVVGALLFNVAEHTYARLVQLGTHKHQLTNH